MDVHYTLIIIDHVASDLRRQCAEIELYLAIFTRLKGGYFNTFRGPLTSFS